MTATRRIAVTLAVAAALLTLAPAPPASAHHGYSGPVRLYLDTVRLEPGPDGWLIRAALHDSGNGKPAPGFVVHAAGTATGGQSAFGPLTLTDTDTDGRYEAAVGQLATGDWTLTVDVADAPGASERAIPLKRTWPVTLHPNQTLDVLGRLPAPKSGDPSGSGPPVPLLLGVAAGLTALAVAARQTARRRTTPTAHSLNAR
jgi:hypothetical protein